jgi:hypothetical protein
MGVMMKKMLWCGLLLVLMTGCAAPNFSGSAISSLNAQNDQGAQINGIDNSTEVVIIRDNETRDGFLDAMNNWLTINNYKHTTIADNSEHIKDKINLVYVGKWSWDLAIYLSDAHIKAFYNSEQVGHVDLDIPIFISSFTKFGRGEKRIFKMMDMLFAVETPYDAE